MGNPLLITSGDCCGAVLAKSGVSGEVFVWHDILYDGPRNPGWPDVITLQARACFLEDATGGGLSEEKILKTLQAQYQKLEMAKNYDNLVLWFDACLFDQAMLSHILTCLRFLQIEKIELICVDSFPGIVPYNGLGELTPEQMASVADQGKLVTGEQFDFAERVDRAFALQDRDEFMELVRYSEAPIPWIPAAVCRWQQEQPDKVTGLGQLEQLALDAINSGIKTPPEIFKAAAANNTPPQFWGDNTLWAKINGLADRELVRIEGPNQRLPQWEGKIGRAHV